MDNSKIKLNLQKFFIFIFIFALICQKCLKKWVKNLLLQFPWKLPQILILIWRIQKLKTIPNILSSSSSFLPWLVKNSLKNVSKFFFTRFSWKLPYNLTLTWIIQKSNSFSQFFSSLFLPWLVKNCLKNESNNFFSDFHDNFTTT